MLFFQSFSDFQKKELEKVVRSQNTEEITKLCKDANQIIRLNKLESQFIIIETLDHLLQLNNQEFTFQLFPQLILPEVKNYIIQYQNHSKSLPIETRQFYNSSVEYYYEYLSLWAHKYPQDKFNQVQYSQYFITYKKFKQDQKNHKIKNRKKEEFFYLKDIIKKKTDLNYEATKNSYKQNQTIKIMSSSNISQQIQDTHSSTTSNKQNQEKQVSDQNQNKFFNFESFILKDLVFEMRNLNAGVSIVGQLKDNINVLQQQIESSQFLNNLETLVFKGNLEKGKTFYGEFTQKQNTLVQLKIKSENLKFDEQLQVIQNLVKLTMKEL